MTDIERVLLNRVKLIGDGEWSLIGTPQELIDEINRLIEQAEKKSWAEGYHTGHEAALSNNLSKGDV